MKFKITAEVEIDDESSHLPVTCDSASKKKEGEKVISDIVKDLLYDICLLYTSPSPRDRTTSRMPSSA